MNIRPAPTGAAAALAIVLAWPLGAQATADDARGKLIRYLDGIARTQLDARKQAIARIQTRAAAERRKALVREKILSLIGGLPEAHGPVHWREFGTTAGNGFRVEKIAYESLPGFWVTANLYVPSEGSGPFPAVVIAPGHGAAGKLEDWNWGGNFARNGIVALAYDPLGQGERLQYYDADKKSSLIGNPTGEHGEANIPPLLIGDDLARYMVSDARRGVDYLMARKDVDSARIGAFGCSGGGTATAYFAALDDRVKVAATACYITSFQELLASPTGVQDAEQSIPRFIEQGLDFGDWVELFAPKPYAIVSTTGDMFPFAGAQQTYEEARRIYRLYGAEGKLEWITGPGGHGNLGPVMPAIVSFFLKNLKGSVAEPVITQLGQGRREDLQCTPTGQVATSIGGETVWSLNRKRAETMRPEGRATAVDIRAVTGAVALPGGESRGVTVVTVEPRNIILRGEDGFEVSARAAIPEGDGAKAALLTMGSAGWETLAGPRRIVIALDPRPTPAGTESIKSPYLGPFNLLSLRTFLVGKTLLGMRVDDVIQAIDWLSRRKDVDPSKVAVYGEGSAGMVMLHAAALDTRIRRVVVENSLAAYRMIVDQPLHRNVSEVVLPGVLRKYDTGGLLRAIEPRPVTIVNPKDAAGDPVSEADYRMVTGAPANVRVMMRAQNEPLPIDY